MNVARLEGHSDGVWDVCLLTASQTGTEHIASASADGTVKIWDVSPGDDEDGRLASSSGLKLSWTSSGTDGDEEEGSDRKRRIVPTSLAICQSDMTRLAVAYQDSLVRIFDTESGNLALTLKSNETYGRWCKSECVAREL